MKVMERLFIYADTGQVEAKPLDFKIVGEPYRGYFVAVKNGNPNLVNFEKGTIHEMKKFKNIWISTEGLIADYSVKYPIYLDKDLNIIGALHDYAIAYNSRLLAASYMGEKRESSRYLQSALIDLEEGKVIGEFSWIRFSKSGLVLVNEDCETRRDGVYGCLSADGKTIIPTKYYQIVLITDNSGTPVRIAAQSSEGIELVDLQGNKIATLPNHGNIKWDNWDNHDIPMAKNFVKLEESYTGCNTWFDIDGKQLTPDGYKFVKKYEKNGKQVGWLVYINYEDGGLIYDMTMTKRIGTKAPVKKRDYIAELYKKRNFIGQALGTIDKMYERGFIKKIDIVWQSSINAYEGIYDITLKDGSVYRIEANASLRIIKAKRLRR